MSQVLTMWNTTNPLPLGSRIFSVLFAQKAPYFATIRPRFTAIEPNLAELVIPKRRRVHNHLGTVHAIAQCNLAEFAMGAVAEATIPASHRWIPRGMTIDYRTKATGTLRAEATLALPTELEARQDLAVEIAITDAKGTEVSHAQIRIWVTAKER